jgi:hypothetical protein
MIAGLLLFIATVSMTMRSSNAEGFPLHLLENFLPGFSVSLPGSFIGLLYLLVLGFIAGAGSAYLRNLIVFLSARFIHRDIELFLLRRMFDFF